MKILIAYYSKSGHNQHLAEVLHKELKSLGHKVETEPINAVNLPASWLTLILMCMPWVPCILFSAFIHPLKYYYQREVDIETLKYPSVAGFDRIIVGGPKWMYMSFPVARYLSQVRGLDGKKVGGFTVFCGPAVWTGFELYPYFHPFNDYVKKAKGEVIAQLAISSGWTDVLLLPSFVFRIFSRLFFFKPLSYFGMESKWGKYRIIKFCELIEKTESSSEDLLIL